MIDGYQVFDFHIHVQPWEMLKPEVLVQMKAKRKDESLIREAMHAPEKFVAFMDEQGIDKAAVVNYESPDLMGFTADVNAFSSDYCKTHPERLVPVGSVHPRFSKHMAEDLDRLFGKLGIRIFKIHPPHQCFSPNAHAEGDENVRLIYEKASARQVPVMVHTGTSIFKGARNKFGDPMLVDDVAVDFPDLKIILAHGGRPLWMETAFFLTRRHRNVFLEISGIPPKRLLAYFPRLEAVADKVLWGSDWPGPGVPSMRQNVLDFLELPLSDKTKRKILWDNAEGMLGQSAPAHP